MKGKTKMYPLSRKNLVVCVRPSHGVKPRLMQVWSKIVGLIIWLVISTWCFVLSITQKSKKHCTVWKNKKFTLTRKIFREITQLPNALISRNAGKKLVKVNFHTVFVRIINIFLSRSSHKVRQ